MGQQLMVAAAVKRKHPRRLRTAPPRLRTPSSPIQASYITSGRKGQSYRGAKLERALADWITESLSADADLLHDLDTLRSRSRDLHRNAPFARGLIRNIVNQVIGTGFTPQSSVDAEDAPVTERQAETFRRRSEKLWKRWAPKADANRRSDFTELLTTIFTSALVDGDCFVLLPRLQKDPFRPLWIACEIIEGHRVSNPDGSFEAAKGRRIREGVELNDFGAPVAIWVEIVDQSDQVFGDAVPRKNWRRIAMQDSRGRPLLLHLSLSQRYGQTRGEPLFAPCLGAFRHLDAFMESELLAKRMEACFGAFITQDLDLEDDAGERDDDGYAVTRLEPAMVAKLAPGEKVTFAEPKRPGSGFGEFVRIILRSIACAFGLPYEVAFRDYQGMNYSNARTAILDARRVFKTWQRYLTVQICTPLWQLVIEEGVLREKLPSIGDWQNAAPELTEVRWVTPGWDWVDPLKEVAAQQQAVAAGFTSKTEVCASRGVEHEEVAKQRKRELDVEAELGLPQPAPGTAAPPDPDDDEEDDEDVEAAA